MIKFKLFFILILFIIIPVNAQQKSEPQHVFTLDECLKIADRNNPDIKLSVARISPAAAEITNAYGEYLPSLSMNLGYTRTFKNQQTADLPDSLIRPNQFTSIKPNYYTFNAGFQYVFFNGFRRSNQFSKAQLNYNSLYDNSMFTRQRVQMDIYRAYVQVILNKQIQKIRQENYELGKLELDRVKARYEAGLTSVNFVYSQEAELGNRELDIVKAENDYKIAKSQLLILMGLNPEMEADFSEASLPNDIDTTEIATFARKIGTFENAVKIAIENRKDIQSIQKQIEAAKKQIKISQSTYWPTLSASGGWSWSNYFIEDFSKLGFASIGLNLSIPVFENFRTNLNIENAKLQLYSREIDLYNIEQTIRQNLRTAILNLQAAEKQLEITNRSLISAQKNYDFSKERYRVGTANVSDFFIANNLLVTTQINRINAIYSYFVAKKEVLFALGLLNNKK